MVYTRLMFAFKEKGRSKIKYPEDVAKVLEWVDLHLHKPKIQRGNLSSKLEWNNWVDKGSWVQTYGYTVEVITRDEPMTRALRKLHSQLKGNYWKTTIELLKRKPRANRICTLCKGQVINKRDYERCEFPGCSEIAHSEEVFQINTGSGRTKQSDLDRMKRKHGVENCDILYRNSNGNSVCQFHSDNY